MDLCEKPSNFMLLESAFQSCFAVFATHVLAGTVDTCLDGGSVAAKLSWLLLYFNRVNLCWRYYSILAYRCLSKNWSEKQLALINFEAFPYRPRVPYVIGERMEDFWVRRLEISGVISSQGMLSVIAAYQGAMAIQFTISTSAVGFLPSISKPIAMLGLIRVMVSNWIASKVYVEPHPYPTEMGDFDSKCNRYLTFGWVVALLDVLMLSFWPYIGYPEFNIRKSYMDLAGIACNMVIGGGIVLYFCIRSSMRFFLQYVKYNQFTKLVDKLSNYSNLLEDTKNWHMQFHRGDTRSRSFICEIVELQRRVQISQDEYSPHADGDSIYDFEDDVECNDASSCNNSNVFDHN